MFLQPFYEKIDQFEIKFKSLKCQIRGILSESIIKSQKEWESDVDNISNIKSAFTFNEINCKKLGDIAFTYFGIQAFDRKSSINKEKLNDNYLKIIDGNDINPFSISNSVKFFNFIESNIKSGGDWNVYLKNRIVVRQIGKIPIVGYCNSKVLTSNTIYNIYMKDNNLDLLYLFTLLNSLFIKNYWIHFFSDNKQLFPKIKGYQLKQIPIKIISKSSQKPFIEKADLMLSLNKQKQEKINKFLHRLETNFEIDKFSNKLKAFYDYDFKILISELKKKKIKLSLSQQDEWEEYFNNYKDEINELQKQIDKTDKEIDQMVYELYGLTKEEIEIVEDN